MEVLEDVQEAVNEQGIVLDELVILGDLAGSQEPELRVNGVVLLGLGSHGCWLPGRSIEEVLVAAAANEPGLVGLNKDGMARVCARESAAVGSWIGGGCAAVQSDRQADGEGGRARRTSAGAGYLLGCGLCCWQPATAYRHRSTSCAVWRLWSCRVHGVHVTGWSLLCPVLSRAV